MHKANKSQIVSSNKFTLKRKSYDNSRRQTNQHENSYGYTDVTRGPQNESKNMSDY